MEYRKVPALAAPISVLSFGGWGIGGKTRGATSYGETDDAESVRALERAFELGINLFDTSNVYGDGHSEALLGQVLASRRDEVLIATKVGWLSYDSSPDFTHDGMLRSLAGSLDRLQTDHVDILQLHNPPDNWVSDCQYIIDALESLRSEGLAKTIGVSVGSPDEALKLAGVSTIGFIQANFNLMDIRVISSGLLETLERNGQYLIARTPLCFGFLTGDITTDTVFSDGDHRAAWPRKQLETWIEGAQTLRKLGEQHGISSPTALALRFCRSFPSVASVLSGMLTCEEVEQNAGAISDGPLEPQFIEEILDLHKTHSFFISGNSRPRRLIPD